MKKNKWWCAVKESQEVKVNSVKRSSHKECNSLCHHHDFNWMAWYKEKKNSSSNLFCSARQPYSILQPFPPPLCFSKLKWTRPPNQVLVLFIPSFQSQWEALFNWHLEWVILYLQLGFLKAQWTASELRLLTLCHACSMNLAKRMFTGITVFSHKQHN